MRRRDFLTVPGVAAAGAPLTAASQDPRKMPRIGFLGNSTAILEANLVGPFREGLRDLGYVDGRNIVIEYRWAEGSYERFPSLIAELLAMKVDVIVTAGTPAALAVKKATASVPLVMVAVGDPVGTGLVGSLGRPGGNATGLTSIAPELEGKRLELLREVLPKISRVAVLWNPANAYQIGSEKEVQAAAKALRISAFEAPQTRTRCRSVNASISFALEKTQGLLRFDDGEAGDDKQDDRRSLAHQDHFFAAASWKVLSTLPFPAST